VRARFPSRPPLSNVTGRGAALVGFLLAIPIGMIAYTGLENDLQPGRGDARPARERSARYSIARTAVFAIYLTLPAIAMMALPVTKNSSGTTRQRSPRPVQRGFKNDPVLGIVSNVGLHGTMLSGLKIYVGLLAATILLIATNAGIIGSSRIQLRDVELPQIPNLFRACTLRLRTPWLSLIFFSATFPISAHAAGPC